MGWNHIWWQKSSKCLKQTFYKFRYRILPDEGGCSAHVLDYNSLDDPLENIIQRFQYHPSISAIKEKISGSIFNFNT